MVKRNSLLASVCATILIAGSPVLSEAQSTKILEEYFAVIQSSEIVLEVGDKEDNSKSTQWNNITLKGDEGKMQIAIPWIKVSKKLLGGFEMTYAQKVEGAFQSPDPKYLEPIRFVVENKGMVVEIDGDEDAREYISSFDEIAFNTLENNVINISAKLTDGTSTQIMKKTGDIVSSSGHFDVKTMMIDYGLEIDGNKMTSTTTMNDFTSKFNVLFSNQYDPDKPLASFDPSRDMFFEYSISSGVSHANVGSALGPVEVDASFGSGSGFFGLKGSVATLSGSTNDISYNMAATAMGMPPMQFSLTDAAVNIEVPLDNLDESKPAGYKITINGLALSDQVWAMFDPKALLPRDEISLDIDLTASLRWLKPLADIDVSDNNQTPPFEVESAKINALNMKIAGAELQTSGEVSVDNSQFPPVPDGTVNISLKGAFGLLNKLTELGMVPAQNAMMIQGMSGAFFKPAGDGEDDLISVITMTKDGHISANGTPLK